MDRIYINRLSPLLVLPWNVFSTYLTTRSKNKENSIGLNGHPYLRPIRIGIDLSSGSSLIIACKLQYNYLIELTTSLGISNSHIKVYHNSSRTMLSYAFLKSMNKQYRFDFNMRALYTNIRKITQLSSTLYPDLNPA